MTYYTMKECFDECGDDDFMVHDETEKFGAIKIKKKDVGKFSFHWPEIDSDKWQIKRAEPRPLFNDEIIAKCRGDKGKPYSAIIDQCIHMARADGHLREWLRPEQVELREAVKDLSNKRDQVHIITEEVNRIVEALENLKPPTTN